MLEFLAVPFLVYDVFMCLALIFYVVLTDHFTEHPFWRMFFVSGLFSICLGAVIALHSIVSGHYTLELGEFLRTVPAPAVLTLPFAQRMRWESKRHKGWG